MVRQVRDVVIVGGGTAGWLTAAIIAARHKARIPHEFTVTLVESPNVPIIGVGEGTWPTLRSTLKSVGISETDFFRECDAAFKQGALFAKWTTGAEDDAYYHPLVLPQRFAQLNLAPHWLAGTMAEGGDNGETFCDAVCPQGRICDENLAPKTMANAEFEGQANYAYHLDAGKFAPFMQRHCTGKLGVRHVLADMREVRQDEYGDIRAIVTEQAGEITGDLFVDCTGMRSLLLGQTLGVPFRDCNDVLFCDTALAMQVPYPAPDAPIATHTISTAQSAGWIWDIGLPTRRGVGHVYSSRHIGREQAEAELRAYVGPAADGLSVRQIDIRSGHRELFWKNNCVAVGLAAGFLEPLEASAIVLIELSAKMIADQMPPAREVMDTIARRFNDKTLYRWGRIIDFLKLHYVLSQRRDTAFWRDNMDPASIPERLQELMALWRFQPPHLHEEFDRVDEVFPSASYQYVLYGMGFRSDVSRRALEPEVREAQRARRENAEITQRMLSGLPRHRDLINRIREFGLQPV
ncbi:tryptophan halogenase family protein [Novosphingobium huizhouense]|uniref:tryptophan halogenase family protein n=1 Tax=Novosphingobium huizhouense TaxID=2866625 RepID=UPI001CD896B0|nr:tryptophan halogenase family protein [Novosphingobium huizhouense]